MACNTSRESGARDRSAYHDDPDPLRARFEQDEGEAHGRAGYSPEKYVRLVELKDRDDPENFFRINQNIPPSSRAA